MTNETEQLRNEVKQLSDEVRDLKLDLEAANQEASEAYTCAQQSEEKMLEMEQGIDRIIHDTIRELGLWPTDLDTPWLATPTTHEMRIAEARRRAGHGN